MSFQHLNLLPAIQEALDKEGYTTPTPIQAQSIPVILSRKDLFGIAQTGTGKTAAFSIPILQIIKENQQNEHDHRFIKALICTPTRELAIQIGESISAYGKFTKLRHAVIFGGVSQHAQTAQLKAGVDILVATPGRLLDLINQKFVDLKHLKIFTLDEADRMLDMGFIHDIKKIITHLPHKRQSLFFSATMPPDILKLASTILNNPVTVEVTPTSSTAEKVDQSVYFVDKNNKKRLLAHLLEDTSIVSCLVFTRTKHGADRVVKDLASVKIMAQAIHGNKSQNARQNALNNFKDGKTRVLVATDIAARGIDVEELSHVVNYELPNIPETYVHRIGRTGRAGASGKAISFCEQEELEYLKDIQKLIKQTIPVVEEHPYPASLNAAPASKPAQKRGGHSRHNNGTTKSDGHKKKKWFGKRKA